MKERIHMMIQMMNQEKEVRIYVDIRADGTGHMQAALNLAERLRFFGYTEQIVFILGQPIFTPYDERAPTKRTYDTDWASYYTSFIALLKKRIPLENYSIYSQDCLNDDPHGIFLRNVIKYDLWHELQKDYIDAARRESAEELAYEKVGFTHLERILHHRKKEASTIDTAPSALTVASTPPKTRFSEREFNLFAFEKGTMRFSYSKAWLEFPFERETKFGFLAAADGVINPCDRLNTEFCIALQPRDWQKGVTGVYTRERFFRFNEDTLSCTMTTLAVDDIDARYQLYRRTFPENLDVSLKLLLDKHIAGKNIVLLYNPSFMRKKIDNTTFLNNLKILFSKSGKDTLFIEFRSSGIPSLWNSAIDDDDEREAHDLRTEAVAQFNVLNLSGLSEETSLPPGSVILCEYLPTPIVDYLMSKAFAIVCEGQGMAQKALEIGRACVHSPMNTSVGIYDKVAEHDAEHDKDAKKKLQIIVNFLVNTTIDDKACGLGYDYLSSDCVIEFCRRLKNEQASLERDQLAHALVKLASCVKPLSRFGCFVKNEYKEYRNSQMINAHLKHLLDKLIHGRKIIFLHNPDSMEKNIDNRSLINNLHLYFSRHCSNVIYIETRSSEEVYSLWSPEEEGPSTIIDLEDLINENLTNENLPNGSVIRCTKLPSSVQNYLIHQSMLVLCADDGIALNALKSGIPCIHSPAQNKSAIYDMVDLSEGDEELTRGKVFLSTISSMLLTFTIEPPEVSITRSIYRYLLSPEVSRLCTYLMTQKKVIPTALDEPSYLVADQVALTEEGDRYLSSVLKSSPEFYFRKLGLMFPKLNEPEEGEKQSVVCELRRKMQCR